MIMFSHTQNYIHENADTDKQAKEAVFDALVRRSISGDSDALCELCEKIAKGVLYLTTYLVGNKTDAEDISQIILIRVFENIKSLREPKAFNVWLAKIIGNESNRYLKNSLKFGVLLNIDDYLDNRVEDNEESLPQEYVENEEQRQAVTGVLSSLTERQKETVMLHYYDGLSVTEVAEVMKISKQSVSEYLAVSRKKLRRELVKTGYLIA